MGRARYESLEFERLLAQLAGYAGSDLTRQLIADIELVFHPARIDENLDQTAEALRFMLEHPSVGLPDFHRLTDLTELWQLIAAGELVDTKQARAMLGFLELCGGFSALLKSLPPAEYPRLTDSAAGWVPLADLLSHTKRVFNDDGEVRDNASKDLYRIREKLRRFEADASRTVRDLLKNVRESTGEDANLAIRNNRFVVLMPRSLAASSQGTVIDYSGSGQSVYFEPATITPLNADRQHLFMEENAEVRRILQQYGMAVLSVLEPLHANLAILAKFDFIFARAKHANALKASRPRLNSDGILKLESAIHPLLSQGFVPEDLDFGESKAIIISGVNAGGKTVLLKVLGLYSLMAAIGCFVPGEANLPYVSEVFASIGDEQSTVSQLSTFTAQLHFIDGLWKFLESQPAGALPALVLMDEIGTGTEPGEGAAFAYGLLTALLEQNAMCAVTTHYDLLKTLAFEDSRAKNVCLEFDEKQLKPTYRVIDGHPGKSYALQIAERWGLDPQVISAAFQALGEEERKMAGVISELEELRQAAENTAAKLKSQSAELDELKKHNEELGEELKESKARFARHAEQVKAELKSRLDEMLGETKKKLKSKARQAARRKEEYVKSASTTSKLVREGKDALDQAVLEVVDSLDLSPPDDDEVLINVGDLVSISGSAVRGPVVEINERKGEAVIEVYGKRVGAKLKTLVHAEQGGAKPFDPLASYRRRTAVSEADVQTSDPLEAVEETLDAIDLHGQTTEEAFESLELFISRCLERNIDKVRIMHGIGTGRLRTFVQDYLRRHDHVRKVSQAEPADGGYGVTIATLK
jgi:DNA mismatch repair protein MutS2